MSSTETTLRTFIDALYTEHGKKPKQEVAEEFIKTYIADLKAKKSSGRFPTEPGDVFNSDLCLCRVKRCLEAAKEDGFCDSHTNWLTKGAVPPAPAKMPKKSPTKKDPFQCVIEDRLQRRPVARRGVGRGGLTIREWEQEKIRLEEEAKVASEIVRVATEPSRLKIRVCEPGEYYIEHARWLAEHPEWKACVAECVRQGVDEWEESRKMDEFVRRYHKTPTAGWGKSKENAEYSEPMSDWDILGIKPDCSLYSMKEAYKTLALKHHPDKGGEEGVFKKIDSAFENLRKMRVEAELYEE